MAAAHEKTTETPVCLICREAMVVQVMTHCAPIPHRFCKSCWSKHQQTSVKPHLCPFCRQDIHSDDVDAETKVMVMSSKEMKTCQVPCPIRPDACLWIGSAFEAWFTHAFECQRGQAHPSTSSAASSLSTIHPFLEVDGYGHHWLASSEVYASPLSLRVWHQPRAYRFDLSECQLIRDVSLADDPSGKCEEQVCMTLKPNTSLGSEKKCGSWWATQEGCFRLGLGRTRQAGSLPRVADSF